MSSSVPERIGLKESAEPIEFLVEGDLVRGTFYRPEQASGPVAAVALAHGWSMVAGGDLEEYAAAVVARGLAALTFDFRNLGRSAGMPRQEIDPQRQIQDFRSAISYLRQRPEVDRERIGIWGSSYSGGHALTVAAIDRRVKCVVSQVPTTSGYSAAQRRVRYDKAQALQAAFEADREARDAGQPPATLRMVDADPDAPVAYPGPDSFNYMTGEARRCPSWVNEVTLRSLELARAYEPGLYVRRIAPTPLLMIVATGDGLTPADLQQDAFNAAHQPKELLLLPGGHYSVYTEHFERTSSAAANWFAQHLGQGQHG
ncbi:alpha/beta hydrolase [Achromobacter anxifer]